METKPLLYGLIGFFVGGLLVAIAATTFEKPENEKNTHTSSMESSMSQMTASLQGKSGEDFDKAFLKEMIVHHQAAVAMAELAQNNAKHDEIRTLSDAIITTQTKEIGDMRLWQTQWNYIDGSMESMSH